MTLDGYSGTGNLYQAGGGARAFIPYRSERFRPYVPLVGGFARGDAAPRGLDGMELYRQRVNGAYFGLGVGSEIEITRSLGLRPEFRFSREFWFPEYGRGNQNNAVRTTIGL
jgi:hypothetical protein